MSKIEYQGKDWNEIGRIKFKKKGIKPIDIVYIRKDEKEGALIGWYAEVNGQFYGKHGSTHDPALMELPLEKRVNDLTLVIEQNAKATLEALTQSEDEETKDASSSEQSKGLEKAKTKNRNTKTRSKRKDK